MSDLTRRGFIGTMAVAAAGFAAPGKAEGGDLSFQNNVPDQPASLFEKFPRKDVFISPNQ